MRLPRWKAEPLKAWCQGELIRLSSRVWNAAKFRAAWASRTTFAWYCAHPKTSAGLLVFGGIATFLGPVLWALGVWALFEETTMRALTAFRSISDAEKTVEAYGKLVSAVGLLLAAPVGLLGVGLASWRTWNHHRDSTVAERKLESESYAKAAEAFAKAVELLGNDKKSIRMGGALALEALGTSTPRLLPQSIKILCATIRENWSIHIDIRSIARQSKTGAEALSSSEFKLFLDVVSKLKNHDSEGIIKLSLPFTKLEYAKFDDCSLRNADFLASDMSFVSIRRSNISFSSFSQANLKSGSMSYSKFERCHFGNANLSEATMFNSNFRDSIFTEANLSGAKITDADLFGCFFLRSDLENADLTKRLIPMAPGHPGLVGGT